MSGGGMFWGEMAQLMHNATVDYGKMAYGIWSDHKARKMQRAAFDYQKQYDRNAIQWRVADAKAAGLHPLAALGAQTTSAVQNVFDGQGGRLNASGVPPMDFSKYSKIAMEQGKLQNEQMRLQNEQLRLKNEAMSLKQSDDRSITSVARKDGFKNSLKKHSLAGFDDKITKLFSFSPQSDGTISIQPSKDINVDDLGAGLSYPEFFSGKWLPNSDFAKPIEAYANSRYPLRGDRRWVIAWKPTRGVYLKEHKIDPNLERFIRAFNKNYNNYDYSSYSVD